MSVVSISKESLPNFLAGNGSIGTTEGKISAVNFPVRKHIKVRADKNNTDTVFVGPPGNAVFALAAGEESPPFFVDQTDKVAIVGGAANQAYTWLAN